MPSEEPECYFNHAVVKHKKKRGWKNFNFEAANFEANRNFLPKFKVTMTPSYVSERSMAIPSKFVKDYLKMKEAPVFLKVLGEESTWQVKYKTWTGNSKRKYKIQDGWHKFTTENHLKVGDTCEFIWTNTTPIKFTVVIDRAAKKLSCSKPEGKTSSDELLKKFLVSHADMHSSIQKFPENLRQFLYSNLVELIMMLKSLPIYELQLKHKDTIFGHLATFRHCSLSNVWLDEVEACINQPLHVVDTHRFQALRDLELQYSKSNEILKREISSMSSLLEVGKANLLDVITQKQNLLSGSSSYNAFFPLNI
ncbi:hypothetical protein Lal_00025590 [Lupinus albus]|uniref:Putative transcription factor B3-Domain family n=1 Tax=Lupinus albus TaxID=3870 RepID=A0A6A4PV39_LUPAL|nr:putative transcription factor B3-Domain family [Lupinus albus]KAF1890257.1 hypothetical protein Lal_00025590 [Lupinus albus]